MFVRALKLFVRIVFWVKNFKLKGDLPECVNKAVLIFAPHTSNWDAFYGLGTFLLKDVPIRFAIKKEMLFFPLGWLLNKLGAIPIDRTKTMHKRKTMADIMIDMYSNAESMYIIIQPEGTRKYVSKWKMGFYEVASKANVPMVLTYIDYPTMTGGFGPTIYPSGDIEKDMEEIKTFYRTIRGKYPENGVK
jgi:1-acyl-sn-glycerol-3-phosphate acyltransferase